MKRQRQRARASEQQKSVYVNIARYNKKTQIPRARILTREEAKRERERANLRSFQVNILKIKSIYLYYSLFAFEREGALQQP